MRKEIGIAFRRMADSFFSGWSRARIYEDTAKECTHVELTMSHELLEDMVRRDLLSIATDVSAETILNKAMRELLGNKPKHRGPSGFPWRKRK